MPLGNNARAFMRASFALSRIVARIGLVWLGLVLAPAHSQAQANLPPIERVVVDSTANARVLHFAIVDAASGKPVPYVLICALDKSGAFAVSDSTGRVGLGGLEDGDLPFRLIAPGYESRDVAIAWTSRERSGVRASLRRASQPTGKPKCPTW